MGQLPPLPYQPPQSGFPLPLPPMGVEAAPVPPPKFTLRVLIAWCLIAVAMTVVICHWSNFRQDAQAETHHTDIQLDITSRYLIGYRLLFGHGAAQSNADGLVAM